MQILKPKEMAKELEMPLKTFNKMVREDKDFPMIRIVNIRRFIKERVVEYVEYKKKLDCVPNCRVFNYILITN